MKKKIIVLVIVVVSLFLTGCVNILRYVGNDKATINPDIVRTSVGDAPVYPKTIPGGILSLGAFNSPLANVLGITVKIQNTQSITPLIISRKDFSVKTKTGYTLKRVSPNIYINAVLGNIQSTEVYAHVLRQTLTILPSSSNYCFLFFEKPNQYPVTITYKDSAYKFTDK